MIVEPFEYPESAHRRRHGPQGYRQARSYRQWLRDEHTFRCVYCLIREQWGRVTGEFDVEHFCPQTISREEEADYDNLRYACARCNLAKTDQRTPDPCECFIAGHVRVLPDGRLQGQSDAARALIEKLGLNSPQMKRWRYIWIRNIELAWLFDPDQYNSLMGFPEDLPNLSRLHPPSGNRRPDGVQQSWYARRERGELPVTY